MELVKHLIETCDDLQASADTALRDGLQALKLGLSQVNTRMIVLEAENKSLRARRDSLEAQVMTLAESPEPAPEDWWSNVLPFSEETFGENDEGDDWEPDFAA